LVGAGLVPLLPQFEQVRVYGDEKTDPSGVADETQLGKAVYE
jgi:hypothetical protein